MLDADEYDLEAAVTVWLHATGELEANVNVNVGSMVVLLQA